MMQDPDRLSMVGLPQFPPRTWVTDGDPCAAGPFQPRSSPSSPPYEGLQKEKSLDLTQKLERKLAELNSSQNPFKRWLFEIASWIISAVSLGSILTIFLYLNNKSLTTWPMGLTISTVLSKLASAALILPTSEALGQLKWNWFNGKRSKEIWDFEIFDKASRGPWGSVMLLFRTKGRSLAALGAILTLLLIANDTFFQQVVDLRERWNLEGNSSIARMVWYEPEYVLETRGGNKVAQYDWNLRPDAMRFFYDNGTQPVPSGNGTHPDIPVTCPTSNCTWPVYETLGVCSRCVDVSQLLTFACRTTRVDWIGNLTGTLLEAGYPNGTMCGYFFNATSELPIMMSGYSTTAVESSEGKGPAGEALLMRALPLASAPLREPYFGDASIHFKDIRYRITDVVIAAALNGSAGVYRNETPLAQECVLYYCVKQIRSSYFWASYQEEVLSTFTNNTPGTYPWIARKVVGPRFNSTDLTYAENVTLLSRDGSSDAPVYGLSNSSHLQIAANFDDIFPSFMTVANSTAKPVFRYKAYITEGPTFRTMQFNPWLPSNNISHHLERLSTALTNRLRSTISNVMVSGSAYSVETYIHVQWAWLTFPLALLILSLLFLVATILKTRSVAGETGPGVWKTSAMPTLIYGLPKDMQRQFTSSSTFSSTAPEGAKNLRVRLHPKKGWRVSGHPCSPDTPDLRSSRAPPGWV